MYKKKRKERNEKRKRERSAEVEGDNIDMVFLAHMPIIKGNKICVFVSDSVLTSVFLFVCKNKQKMDAYWFNSCLHQLNSYILLTDTKVL